MDTKYEGLLHLVIKMPHSSRFKVLRGQAIPKKVTTVVDVKMLEETYH